MDSITLYNLIKTVHILSAMVLLGTGFGTAFYLFVANRTGNVSAISVVSYWVCKADFWFTTPCVFVQFFTGLWLMNTLKMPWSATWIWASLALFFFVGICWLPVVVWQLKMRDIAKQSIKNGDKTLPKVYWQLAKKWELAGYPAFLATLSIVFLMVFKPMSF